MPLTKEQLLIPRWKIIGKIPFLNKGDAELYPIGGIITDDGIRPATNQNGDPVFITKWEEYPHIFKSLEWHEQRELIDMPEYVRYSVYYLNHYHLAGYPQYENKIFKIEKWENGHYGMKAIGEGIIHPYEINFYPVDESEYNAYINQKQQ